MNLVTRDRRLIVSAGIGAHYEDVLNNMVGYADHDGCTGGAGKSIVTVTNLDDTGGGSLRNAIAGQSNRWIRFTPNLTGSISLATILTLIGSNWTIDGRGANITIDGHGFRLTNGGANAIFMYLKFAAHDDESIDQIELTTNATGGFDKAWLYKCSFTGQCDENVSFNSKGQGPGPTGVTLQECLFEDCNRAWLVGNTETSFTDGDNIEVTAYRNYSNRGFQRFPRTRGGHVDLLNNWLNLYGSQVDATGYGGVASQNATIRSQANIFTKENKVEQGCR